MVDPTQFPIENAIVAIEVTPAGGGRTEGGTFREVEAGIVVTALVPTGGRKTGTEADEA